MSYDVTFKVKVEGVDEYVPVGDCDANITWNVGKIIRKSTGLPWKNEASNGYCKDVMPFIHKGLDEVSNHPEKYKKYEDPNGWGTVDSVRSFFLRIINAWDDFRRWTDESIVNVTTFWVE